MPESYGGLGLKIPKPKGEAPNGPQAFKDLIDSLEASLAGMVIATVRSEAPEGFLLCDGSAVSRATYARLFEAIGVSYGPGDGSTTFTLPDLRGRVPVGVDGTANRLSANDTLGKSAGEEKHVLTVGEMPSHSHKYAYSPANRGVVSAPEAQVLIPSSKNENTEPSGGGESHNNMPPYQVVNYMIKT